MAKDCACCCLMVGSRETLDPVKRFIDMRNAGRTVFVFMGAKYWGGHEAAR